MTGLIILVLIFLWYVWSNTIYAEQQGGDGDISYCSKLAGVCLPAWSLWWHGSPSYSYGLPFYPTNYGYGIPTYPSRYGYGYGRSYYNPLAGWYTSPYAY